MYFAGKLVYLIVLTSVQLAVKQVYVILYEVHSLHYHSEENIPHTE